MSDIPASKKPHTTAIFVTSIKHGTVRVSLAGWYSRRYPVIPLSAFPEEQWGLVKRRSMWRVNACTGAENASDLNIQILAYVPAQLPLTPMRVAGMKVLRDGPLTRDAFAEQLAQATGAGQVKFSHRAYLGRLVKEQVAVQGEGGFYLTEQGRKYLEMAEEMPFLIEG